MAGLGEATPHDGSLEGASHAIVGLLSPRDSRREDTPSAEPQPEQPTRRAAPTPQAPAAPDRATSERDPERDPETPPDGSEQDERPDEAPETPPADADAPDDPPAPVPARLLKVKLPDGEQDLPEEEVVKGYLRTADYTRKTQELAKQRRDFEEHELAAVRTERAQYKDYLGQLQTAIQAMDPKEPDWPTLRATLPIDQYVAQKDSWEERQKQVAQIRTEQARIAEAEAADAAAGFTAYVQAEQAKLVDALPDYGNSEKAPVLKRELSEFAKGRGFTDADLEKVTDHRLVLLLHDAMQYRKAQAKAPQIRNKIDQVIEATAPGTRSPASPKSKLATATGQLRKSGRLEDAALAITELI